MLCTEGWLEGFTVFHAVAHPALPLARRSCLYVVGGQATDDDEGDE